MDGFKIGLGFGLMTAEASIKNLDFLSHLKASTIMMKTFRCEHKATHVGINSLKEKCTKLKTAHEVKQSIEASL
ncbi:hypothetical protein ACET3Z_016858 [Daucus carota]